MTDATGRAWTASGTAKLSTAQYVSGGSSLLLSGASTDYISTPHTSDLDFGAGDFDIRAYIRPTVISGNHCVAAYWAGGSPNLCTWLLYVTSAGKLQLSVGFGATNAGTPSVAGIPINAWTKVRAFRQGAQLRYEINDVLDSATYNIGSNALNVVTTEPVRIGYAGGTNGFNGYIDNFQLSKA